MGRSTSRCIVDSCKKSPHFGIQETDGVISYVLGHEAMKRMGSSNVLVVGLKGLGVEIGTFPTPYF